MQKPLQLNGSTVKWIQRIMVGGFVTLAAGMISFILITWHRGNVAKIRDLELNGAVTDIRQPDHHETKWFVAKLTDSNSIVLEDAMLGVLQVGDSLFKKKGEGYYRMKKAGTGIVTRIRIIQP